VKTELLRENTLPVPLFPPPHIPHGLAWYHTAWTILWPVVSFKTLEKF